MYNNTEKNIKRKKSATATKSKKASVVTTTYGGKSISFRILSSTEIKTTRNSAYTYLK